MSRPLPVNLLLAGTGAVLLTSGLSGQSLGNVIKGDFGKLDANPNAGGKEAGAKQTSFEGEPATGATSTEEPQTVPSPSTLAPSPTSLSVKHGATEQQILALNRKLAARNLHLTRNELRALLNGTTSITQVEQETEGLVNT